MSGRTTGRGSAGTNNPGREGAAPAAAGGPEPQRAEPPRGRPRRAVLRLKITLLETDPPVWRRVLVPTGMTLDALHRVVQILMGWYDYHLYQFRVGGRRFIEPLPDEDPFLELEGLDATRTTLGKLELRKGDRFSYVYDFGDDWRHGIVVEARHRPGRNAWLPCLVDGERAAPPEDCGGTPGYADLVEALSDPSTRSTPKSANGRARTTTRRCSRPAPSGTRW